MTFNFLVGTAFLLFSKHLLAQQVLDPLSEVKAMSQERLDDVLKRMETAINNSTPIKSD